MNANDILLKMAKHKSLGNDERDYLVIKQYAYFAKNIYGGQIMILTKKGQKIIRQHNRKLYKEMAQ